MRQVITIVLAFFIGLWVMKGCAASRRAQSPRYNRNVTVTAAAADGLDLTAVLELVKSVSSATELEKKLNAENGVNNLDLNADGKVDFIKVTEFGDRQSEAWGFSLTTEPAAGEEQEIASISIEKAGEQAAVQVRGNEQVYGHNHYYHTRYPLSSFLLWSYLLTPHPLYVSPWYWGSYPGYYRSYPAVGRSIYRTRTTTYTRNSTATAASSSRMRKASSLNNPKRGVSANKGIRTSLANPTATQRQFQARSARRASRSGGFGRSSRQGRTTRSGGFGRSGTRRRSSSSRGFSTSRGGYGGFGK